MLDEGLGPAMARGMSLVALALGQIAADIARRHAERAADGAEDMGMVLADAGPLLQRLGAGGVDMSLAGAIGDGFTDGHHDLVQRLDGIALELCLLYTSP